MKIENIVEVFDHKIEGKSYLYEGYRIITSTKIYELLIDNVQSCCEDFGHITSEDNFKDFIGAEIKSIRCIDNADYNEIKLLKDAAGNYVDVFDCAFVDIDTDKGKLQFAVYNAHNGYYGHNIILNTIDTTPLYNVLHENMSTKER